MLGRVGITTVVLLVGVAGCAGSSAPSAVPGPSTTSASSEPTTEQTTAPAAPPTTEQTSESITPTSQPPRPSVSVSATSAAPSSSPPGMSTSAPTPPAPETRWPPALGEPAQGDPVWAVYLAVAHSTSAPAMETAVRQAAGVGYTGVSGDLACDQGATEALGLDQFDYWSAVSLYFATQQQATRFIASYRGEVAKVVGYTRVKVGCLD